MSKKFRIRKDANEIEERLKLVHFPDPEDLTKSAIPESMLGAEVVIEDRDTRDNTAYVRQDNSLCAWICMEALEEVK